MISGRKLENCIVREEVQKNVSSDRRQALHNLISCRHFVSMLSRRDVVACEAGDVSYGKARGTQCTPSYRRYLDTYLGIVVLPGGWVGGRGGAVVDRGGGKH